MKKTAFFLAAIALLTAATGRAVPTDEIAALRQRLAGSGLAVSDSDRVVIDRFWRIALDAMLLSEDPAQLVSIRRQIQQEKGDEPLSFYATVYIQIGREHLNAAFETIARWDNPEKMVLMERNLMILAAQLQSGLLADIALERLAHEDPVVRYWAVKTVAGSAIARQLIDEATGDQVLAAKIVSALAARAEAEPKTDILRILVTFSGMVNQDEARDMLMTMAQRRIKAYMDWNVEDEQFDAALLKTMGQVVLALQDSDRRAATARRFAELFSMVFQRYMTEPSPLSEEQKRALVNVILEVDNQILTRVMGQQTPFIRLFQRGGAGLDREYEAFFGSDMGAGQLAARLNFNYGRTPDGRVVNAPPKLPPPSP